jgi:hypothetical protein
MKKVLLLIATVVSIRNPASATACAPGTLMGFINMGPDGCQLGTVQVSGFAYTGTASGGAKEISTDDIAVAPLIAPNGAVGLMFAAPWHIGAGQGIGSQITYQLLSPDAQVQVQQVALDGEGFRAGPNSSVTVQEAVADGQVTSTLEIYLTCTDSCSSATSANLPIAPATSLTVEDLVTVQSNQSGVSMSRFADWFVLN